MVLNDWVNAELVAALHRVQLRVIALGDGARGLNEGRRSERRASPRHGERERREERERIARVRSG
jgi:hypothetical protein